MNIEFFWLQSDKINIVVGIQIMSSQGDRHRIGTVIKLIIWLLHFLIHFSLLFTHPCNELQSWSNFDWWVNLHIRVAYPSSQSSDEPSKGIHRASTPYLPRSSNLYFSIPITEMWFLYKFGTKLKKTVLIYQLRCISRVKAATDQTDYQDQLNVHDEMKKKKWLNGFFI